MEKLEEEFRGLAGKGIPEETLRERCLLTSQLRNGV